MVRAMISDEGLDRPRLRPGYSYDNAQPTRACSSSITRMILVTKSRLVEDSFGSNSTMLEKSTTSSESAGRCGCKAKLRSVAASSGESTLGAV